MKRLNEVIEQYGRWADLKTYTERIEAHVQSDFSLSLENSKSLLETICKEICKSKGVVLGSKPTINSVLKTAFIAIGYPNTSHVTQISTGLATIGQQIGDLRNEIGTTAHGKSLDEIKERNSKVDELTKEFLIDSTEIVASFLIRNFENENPRSVGGTSEPKILLTDNPDFNEFWDESFNEFTMGEYSYTASEILYHTDNEAYLTELKAYMKGAE
jgi:hypothetical protein